MASAWAVRHLLSADFLYSHMLEGNRDLSGVFFIRAVIPFMRSGPSQLKHLPKACMLIPLHQAQDFKI